MKNAIVIFLFFLSTSCIDSKNDNHSMRFRILSENNNLKEFNTEFVLNCTCQDGKICVEEFYENDSNHHFEYTYTPEKHCLYPANGSLYEIIKQRVKNNYYVYDTFLFATKRDTCWETLHGTVLNTALVNGLDFNCCIYRDTIHSEWILTKFLNSNNSYKNIYHFNDFFNVSRIEFYRNNGQYLILLPL